MEGSIEAGGDAGASSGGGGAAAQHPLSKSLGMMSKQGLLLFFCLNRIVSNALCIVLMHHVDGEAEINSESGLEEEALKSGEISIRRSRYLQSRKTETFDESRV